MLLGLFSLYSAGTFSLYLAGCYARFAERGFVKLFLTDYPLYVRIVSLG